MDNKNIELCSNNGSEFDDEILRYKTEWSFMINAEGKDIVVYADSDCAINLIRVGNDGRLVIHLNKIPARIDRTDRGDIWLFDGRSARIHTTPYKSYPEVESHTIYVAPEYEQALQNGLVGR